MDTINFTETVARMRAKAANPSRMERRDAARSIVDLLANGKTSKDLLKLVDELAEDPLWEVRREIAEAILFLPLHEMARVACRLEKDTNLFVQRAASRAMERRRQGAREIGVTTRNLELMEEKLRRLEKRYGDGVAREAWKLCEHFGAVVVGSMVHDMRNILGSLDASGQALIAEGDKRRKQAARHDVALSYLGRIVNDMEAFVKPVPTERHRERLAELVRAATDLARQSITRYGGHISQTELFMEVPEDITVDAFRHGLIMALTNVIKNALEACLAASWPTEVRIEATSDGELVRLVIRDNGIGMSPEEKAGCLRFMPGRRNPSKRYSTGYGLPIAVRNVAAHRGNLEVESMEDIGTRVTITLPLNDNHDDEGDDEEAEGTDH